MCENKTLKRKKQCTLSAVLKGYCNIHVRKVLYGKVR
jgi:hypothetical protein